MLGTNGSELKIGANWKALLAANLKEIKKCTITPADSKEAFPENCGL